MAEWLNVCVGKEKGGLSPPLSYFLPFSSSFAASNLLVSSSVFIQGSI
jgi:hypothetical protein